MLQLTEASNGQITGVLSVVQLDRSGEVKADTSSITGGTLDGAQLTLTLHPGIFGTNISGTRSGNLIRLQSIDREGHISSSTFVRGSASAFSACTDKLQQKSAIIAKNSTLSAQTREFVQAVHEADTWMRNAQVRAGQIPKVEAQYKEIQDQMQKLTEREQRIADIGDRFQISLDVNQKRIDGDLLDIDVDQAWSWPIEDQLKPINQRLAKYATVCNQRGAEQQGIEPAIRQQWESGCRTVMAEQSSFLSTAHQVMDQRSVLKTYQAQAKLLRESTVATAERLAK